jgi:Protein of unknown function (DUF551)
MAMDACRGECFHVIGERQACNSPCSLDYGHDESCECGAHAKKQVTYDPKVKIVEVRLDAKQHAQLMAAARPEWRTIETAPEDGTEVMLFCHTPLGTQFMSVGYCVRDDWQDSDGTVEPTHWMPLPSPPKVTR